MSVKAQRLVIYAGLAGIILLAWAYLVSLAAAQRMTSMGMDLSMPAMQAWGVTDAALTFGMWVVMMVAMMTPSAAPVLLLFRALSQKKNPAPASSVASTGLFLMGYLIVWAGFSLLATLAQWGLHSAALLTPAMSSASPLLGGALLIAAGIYQFTPLKNACLTSCRTPLGFLMSEWREGKLGPLLMGMKHGLSCVGCCWMLMALLFVGGVMNLVWVALIAAYILIEKVAPARVWLPRLSGSAAIVWGLALIGRSLF